MELINMLPDYYRGNLSMEEVQRILSSDINTLANKFNETIDQCFVNTATSLLSRYEKMYGIEVDVSKNNRFRRERIKAKVRGAGTVTKQMIIDTAASFSNGEVEVIENYEDYSFKIKFVGVRGVPGNLADLAITIEEIKPAHLNFTFEFTYLTWNELDGYNKTFDEWDNLNLTWDEFETYREVI